MRAHSAGTGENAHGWAEVFGECTGLEVMFPAPLKPHAADLLAVLGVVVVIDEKRAPRQCCTKPSGRRGLTRTERRARGLQVYDPPS